MVMEGHGRSYPNTRCVNNVRKVTGGGGWVVACRIIVPSPGPGLCHSQRFFERFFGDSLRDSLEMDLVRSLTKMSRNKKKVILQVGTYFENNILSKLFKLCNLSSL